MQKNNLVDANSLYEAALQPAAAPFKRWLSRIWTACALSALAAFAFAEPFSAMLFRSLLARGVSPILVNWLLNPAVMVLRAVLLVESVGYFYHRFFEHVGWLTRRSKTIRRNQRFHWIHHMIIYPIGRLYQRRVPYVPSETGVSLSWVVPALIVAGVFVALNGVNIGSAAFLAGMYWWAKLVVDKAHSRFHEIQHPWAGKRYFQWLEQIHILHHWDQRANYTIVFPAMDVLFGTYLSPGRHRRELEIATADDELTVSDVINWRYLLVEATPEEYAAFISNARQHPRSLKKVQRLIAVLEERLRVHPDDAQAQLLQARARQVYVLCKRKN